MEIKGEVSLYTWERIAEERGEGNGFAMVVVLEVDGALREESGLVCVDFVEDEFTTVLRDHTGDERAVGDIMELCRPHVGVRGIHSAWSKETNSCER